MRGIATINDDLYYERPDGTYARLPYNDGEAVAKILMDRLEPEELRGLIDGMLQAVKEPPRREAGQD